MALFISSLNSGSNGNCYYLGDEHDAVFIDAGLNCRETERRMSRLGLAMDKVRAIFVSHEHSDHIRGIEVLSRKYRLPVYITPRTCAGARLKIDPSYLRSFSAHEQVTIGNISITAFPKYHDASEPHSFIVSNSLATVGVFTDIGRPCDHVVSYFRKCHAIFLESNYDEEMLERGRYPWFLKNRIRSGFGHLSNRQALELFMAHRSESLSHVFLSHLSRDNNSPEVALRTFKDAAGATHVQVASRDCETPVFQIRGRHDTEGISHPGRQFALFE